MFSIFLNILLGGWDAALEILLIIMALDYITGVAAAFRTKSVNSGIGYTGLLKKACIFIIVILAAQMDRMVDSNSHLFRNATALSFSVNDALSVLENAGLLGLKIPSFLRTAFVRLRQRSDAMITDGLKEVGTGKEQAKENSESKIVKAAHHNK